VNVTPPEDVLQQIDQFAEAHGYTRSGFLTQAAKRVMEEEKDCVGVKVASPQAYHALR
jgi:metal-responsive CopG/Arc/MetJ family transcriptional regulator